MVGCCIYLCGAFGHGIGRLSMMSWALWTTMDHLSSYIDGSRVDSLDLQPKTVLLPQPVN